MVKTSDESRLLRAVTPCEAGFLVVGRAIYVNNRCQSGVYGHLVEYRGNRFMAVSTSELEI